MPNTDAEELVLETDTAGKLFSIIDIYKRNGWHTKGHPYLDLETQVYSQKVYKYQLNDNFSISYTVKEGHVSEGPRLTDWEKIVADKLSKRNPINTMLVTLSELIVDKLNQLDTTQKATFTLLEDTKTISYITYKSLTGELTYYSLPNEGFNLTLKHLNDVKHNNPDTMVSDTLRFGILNPNKQEELQVFADKFANTLVRYEPYTNKTKQSV